LFVDFGALAAERERGRLASVFIESTSFERLVSGQKIIVLGNRGAGKTAALSMLATQVRDKGGIVVDLAPEDFAYELLSQTLQDESAGSWSKQGAYAAAWKYLLYLLAMKSAIKTARGLKTGPTKRVYAYLRDHYVMDDLNPIGTLVSYLKRLESIKLGKYEAAIKARELQRLYRLEEIEGLLQDLEEIATAKPILLVVDELDRGWDASENAVAFVAGLFQAGTAIGIRTPHVRVVMSLRRELYENIPSLYEDAQKVRDTIEPIDWTRVGLLELISRRISESLKDSPGAPSSRDAWKAVMPSKVRGTPSFDYILDFTLYRPRELIQFCSQTQDAAVRLNTGIPFTEEAVLEAQAVYARERFNDIVAEYRYQFPGLGSIFETFRGKTARLPRSELELHCLELSLGDVRVHPDAAWVAQKEPDFLIDILWRVGFLKCGVKSQNGTVFVGAYQSQSLNIHNVESFRIHDMFATHLGLLASGVAD